jgi:hypothetical protein
MNIDLGTRTIMTYKVDENAILCLDWDLASIIFRDAPITCGLPMRAMSSCQTNALHGVAKKEGVGFFRRRQAGDPV